ncbi:MAG: hypothetical protein FWH18_11855 [Marinilabiliaceae bacterium]|nr:hypothetical protein [Marinilabiliaceae bacterium]
MYNRFSLLIISVFIFPIIFATEPETSDLSHQKITIDGTFETGVVLSGKSIVPFWFTSRQEGRWGVKTTEQFLTTAHVSLSKNLNNWNFLIDAELDYNTDLASNSILNTKNYLHHGFLKIDCYFLNLTLGRHKFSPIFEEEYYGSGSYLFGDNFRPMDRITASIPEYTKIPFTFGRIEIRGGITHAKLDDTNSIFTSLSDVNYFHKDVLLHEKYAYLRADVGKWKPYFGFLHSALMGGHDGYGRKIPIDYWNSFFAKSSDTIGGGDATNAAGAHMGMYDIGIYTTHNFGNIHFYYQKPFSDGSGMTFLRWNKKGFSIFKNNKDQIVGLNMNFKNIKWLTNLTVEWINTKYQSGLGTPDPVYQNINGETKTISSTTLKQLDLNKFMKDEFGIDGQFSFDDVWEYLQNSFNKGYEYGGRDGYMSNYAYLGGWTFDGMIMGSPLNLTRDQIAHLNPNLGTYNRNYIINDRFRAFHIGGKGNINDYLIWKVMFTFSVNWGSYFNEYPGRYTWERTENYFFDGGLKQFYSMIGIEWNPKNLSKLTLKSDFALDKGDIFNNFGAKIGVVWGF